MDIKDDKGSAIHRKLEMMQHDPEQTIHEAIEASKHASVPAHIKMIVIEPLLRAKHFGFHEKKGS